MNTLYQIALVTHIIGLAMMAGTTVGDYVIVKQFWKQYVDDKSKAIAINETISKFPTLFGIGILLLILSGVTMMVITKGVFGEQIWFQIKFGLILLIIINAFAIRKRQGTKLMKLFSQETSDGDRIADSSIIKNIINWFHLSQITFFVIVFILSVFKFN